MLHPALDVTLVEGGVIGEILQRRYAREQQSPRTGLHCSTILDDMMRTLYPAKYKRGDEGLTQEQRLALWEFGNAYEDVIAEQLRRRFRRFEKPEPRQKGGLWFSPDGWRPASRTIDEIKSTWVSRRDFLDSPKFLYYLYQGMCYAHVWRARRIRYHILFVVADYRQRAPFPVPMTATATWGRDPDVPRMYYDQVRQHARDRGWLARAA